MLKPIILFTSITSTIGTLQIFDEIMNITKGGPGNATMSISQYIYNLSFKYSPDFGYAATVSYSIVLMIDCIGPSSSLKWQVIKMAKNKVETHFSPMYSCPLWPSYRSSHFFWMLVSSTNASVDVTRGRLLPGSAFLDNFTKLLDTTNLVQALGNSAIVSVISTVLALLIGSMAGYGFEVYRTNHVTSSSTSAKLSLMIPFAA